MVITFEGAPAVGKSTTASKLEERLNYFVVPEVYKFFHAADNNPPFWYHHRQIARWEIAAYKNSDTQTVILDGDVFQQIWFNWAFSDEDHGPFDEVFEFYRSMVLNERASFPDVYVFFNVHEEERAKREETRSLAIGRTSEAIEQRIRRYSRLRILQKIFFDTLSNRFPGLVVQIDASLLENSIDQVKSLPKVGCQAYDIDVIEFAATWCKNNDYRNFLT